MKNKDISTVVYLLQISLYCFFISFVSLFLFIPPSFFPFLFAYFISNIFFSLSFYYFLPF